MTMTEKKKEEVILNYMKMLELSREEAEELWLFDNDKSDNEEADALTQKVKDNKIMGTIHGAGHEKTSKSAETGEKKPRTRKDNLEKAEIIAKIFEFVANFTENAQITNKERQIAFKIGDNEYELTLVAKRKKK